MGMGLLDPCNLTARGQRHRLQAPPRRPLCPALLSHYRLRKLALTHAFLIALPLHACRVCAYRAIVDARIGALWTPGSDHCGRRDRPRGHRDRGIVDAEIAVVDGEIGHVDTEIGSVDGVTGCR
jgi:hypothetical protein